MMSKFKIIFEVQDDQGNTIISKQMTQVDLSIEELAGPALAEAAMIDIERKRSGQIEPSATRCASQVREIFTAAGSVLSRYIELKLREWARAQG
jgi:hypothetical protein